MRRLIILAATLAIALLSVVAPAAAADSLAMTLVKDGFDNPVDLVNAGDDRLFVVEQAGVIKIIHTDTSVTTFLDISGLVGDDGIEQGLLGIAFHPDYATNGLFYVYYTASDEAHEVLAEYKVSTGDADVADPTSARILMTLADPYSNHNGGWLGFKGDYLYIGLGDGGSGGDPQNRAQDVNKWWGKILRIDPLDPDGSGPLTYSVPASNPHVGRTGKDEIWSYGLRNPWRCSFDDLTGQLWCGDVGQDAFEEIDRVKSGKNVNFGWRKLEGRHYYRWNGHTRGTLCTGTCYKLPIADYPHNDVGNGGRCAITGGYVSRRTGADLYGKYIFGDWCSGELWVIPANFVAGSALPAPVDTTYRISSFGEDNLGRIYLVDRNGAIYRFDGS